MRSLVALAAASLLAGCVQPVYPPVPFELQHYGALPPYRRAPPYRAPLPPPTPVPLQEPLPAPDIASPMDSGPPATDETGPIPLQDMPQPAPDVSSSANSQSSPPTGSEPPSIVRKSPASGPGSKVPLEGFRPMRGQTKPAP